MAVEDVNQAGGIKSMGGARIRLIFGDTRGEADIGVTETERLITIKARTLVDGVSAAAKKAGGVKSAVVFSENTEWGKSVGDEQKTFLEGLGVKVHFVEHYPCAAPDLTSMVVKAKGSSRTW
jgi:ABC-type branched-subunit amino acid transport system substrate-binding protein